MQLVNQTYSCYVHNDCDYYSFDNYGRLTDQGYKHMFDASATIMSMVLLWIFISLCKFCQYKMRLRKMNKPYPGMQMTSY